MQYVDGGVPRRCRIDLYTPAETAIREAVGSVEAAGAHPLLTEAVMLLTEAKEKVADYVEMTDAQRTLVCRHGTIAQFAEACNMAADRCVITTEEAQIAIAKYKREWAEAGTTRDPSIGACGLSSTP